MSISGIPSSENNPAISELQREKEMLQHELRKKPIVFVILAGAGFLLAISFLRISLETYASYGDEKLISMLGTVMLLLAILFLAASIVFLVIFLVKMSRRKLKNQRIQEIDKEIQKIQHFDPFIYSGGP